MNRENRGLDHLIDYMCYMSVTEGRTVGRIGYSRVYSVTEGRTVGRIDTTHLSIK